MATIKFISSFLILFIFSNLILLVVESQSGDSHVIMNDAPKASSIETKLEMSATLEKSTLSPGDKVKVDIFFYGFGIVKDHKFIGHIPNNIIDGDVEVISFSFATSPNFKEAKPVFPPQKNHMSNRFVVKFNDSYFSYSQDEDVRLLRSEQEPRMNNKKFAPISVSFTLSNDAPPGEHTLTFKLVYSDGREVGIASDDQTIRILSYGERNQNFLMAILAGLIFVGGLLFDKEIKYKKILIPIFLIFFVWILYLLLKY